MEFTCAELLGLSHSFQFWGDSANYRNITNISIRGRVTGDPGAESISGVWRGINDFTQYTGIESVTINGYSIGVGRLVSIDFDEGVDVTSKKYAASLEILDTGNLWNYTGSYYSGFYGTGTSTVFGSDDLKNLKYVNNFSEDVSCDTSNSGEYKRTKTISFEVDEAYTGDPKSFFSGVYGKIFRRDDNLSIFNALYPNYYSGDPITYESFSYDDIARQYNATQEFTYGIANPWTWNYRHNLSYNKDGTISATEEGGINSTRLSGTDKNYYCSYGWGVVETGIYGRLSNIYNLYTTSGQNKLHSGTCDLLVDYPVSFSLTKNTLVGTINYSKTYTNDQAQKTGYSYVYSDEISVDELNNIVVSENGSYKGFGSDRVSGYSLILNEYTASTGNIYQRLNALYTGNYSGLVNCANVKTLRAQRTEETYQEYRQQLDYSYVYSDDRNILQDDNFYRIAARYTNVNPVLSVGYYNIINDAEIAQRQQQSTPGVFSNNVVLIGTDSTTVYEYLDKAYEKVIMPANTGTFLSDVNYSLKKPTNEFSLLVEYTYFDQPASPDTIL